MAVYAQRYGFRTYIKKEICGREDDFVCLDGDCYISNADFEMLEEIIDKEN